MTQGSENRVRQRHLTIRLSPDERAAIETAAERAGLTAGSYARRTLLGAPVPRQGRRPPADRQELSRLVGLFGNLGSNINQIARAANTGDDIDPMELGRALGILKMLRDELLKALGRSP
jgi:hypothetical protein